MPKMAASKLKGKTITAKMVSSFTISLVLSVKRALLVCSRELMVSFAIIRVLMMRAQWLYRWEKYGV